LHKQFFHANPNSRIVDKLNPADDSVALWSCISSTAGMLCRQQHYWVFAVASNETYIRAEGKVVIFGGQISVLKADITMFCK